ncbi:MAG: TIM barrel protein [Armatimonadota bacterium]|nr:TIM barrel protein [Armatimonadota bacterium]
MNEFIFAFDNREQWAAPKEEVLPLLKTAGFDGIEIPIHPDFIGVGGVHDLAVLKGMLADHELNAPAIATFWDSPCEPMDHDMVRGMLNTADALTSLTHSRVAVVRLGVCPPDAVEEALKNLTGVLIMASNHFDPAGMEVALEFKSAGLLGTYGQAMDWLYLHNPQVGLAVDTESLALSHSDAYRAATELGKRIELVYLTEPSDSKRFNLREFFSGLKTAGFTGPFAIRTHAPLDAASLTNTLAAVRQLWADAPVEAVAVTEA